MTAVQQIHPVPALARAQRSCRRHILAGLAGALTFLAGYLAVDPVRDAVASSPLPPPEAADGAVYRYLIDNLDAVALAAGCQLLSAHGLLVFMLAVRPAWGVRPPQPAVWGYRAGLAAVAALAGAGMLSLLLVTFATGLPAEHAVRLHAIASATGGAAYLACVAAFVALTALRLAYPRGAGQLSGARCETR